MVRSGMKLVCAPALLADFGGGHPLDHPRPEALGVARDLLLQRVGREGGQGRPAARQDPEDRADARSPQDRREGRLEVGPARHQVLDLSRQDAAVLGNLQVGGDLADPEEPHDHRHEVHAVRDVGDAERQARNAGVHVDADEPGQDADQDHGDGLERGAVRQDDRGDQPHDEQAEVLGGGELERQGGQRRAEERNHDGRDAAGEEGGDGRDGQRRAGAPLAGHLVPVEAGHDGGGFPGDVHQDGRGRAAVLRPVEDPGQHDHRRGGGEAEGERQQHGRGVERRDAREHPDQRPDQDAEQAEEEVLHRKRGGETQGEIVEETHETLLTTAARRRAAGRGRTRTEGP